MGGSKFICLAIFAFVILSAGIALAQPANEKAAEKAPPPTCDGKVANVVGTDGDDILTGFLGGNDQISGKEGKDIICGGDGNDVIQGNRGPDVIYGEAGDDRIEGNRGDDIVYGGDGNDYIEGNKGEDFLDGGPGIDSINGGKDKDKCLNYEQKQKCNTQ